LTNSLSPDFQHYFYKNMQEHTLDPQNWEEFRQLAHQMLDDAIDYLRDVGERPAWKKVPASTLALTQEPLPQEGQDAAEVYAEFKTHILPYTKGNIHPRFFSWVQGTGVPMGVMADLLASTMNPNVAIGDHAAMYVDQQVINWCKSLFDFPETASGMLVSGGTIANLTGLTVARNSFLEGVRDKGLLAFPQLVVYSSVETHSCNQKAVEVLGIGNDFFRRIPVDENYRIRIPELKAQIAADRAAGLTPFCIVGNAGTVNTGAIDPIGELLAIARAEDMWIHVDGAFGALAYLVPEYREEVKALAEVDSMGFDLHKWLYLPYEIGCALIRDKNKHRAAFALQPTYLNNHDRGLSAGPDPTTNYGIELSRGFKALKAWMSIKNHGIEKFKALIAQNVAQCRYLGQLIENHPQLELLAPIPLNVVCFRFNPGGKTQAELNELNKELLMRLHESGVAAPSNTLLNGNYAIRVAHVNFRTQQSDMDLLVETVLRIGENC
jgi:aromatic-L-amino-acid/L-tryptophan decarboxylase